MFALSRVSDEAAHNWPITEIDLVNAAPSAIDSLLFVNVRDTDDFSVQVIRYIQVGRTLGRHIKREKKKCVVQAVAPAVRKVSAGVAAKAGFTGRVYTVPDGPRAVKTPVFFPL